MEQTKTKVTLKGFFLSLFGDNNDLDDLIEITDKELIAAMKKADELGKEAKESVHTEKNNKNGGFSNGLKSKNIENTLEKMRQNLEIKEKDEEEIER